MSKYKLYNVTVDIKTYDDRVYNTQHFLIKARDAEEAEAIVHNKMVFSREPKFEITDVKEVE